MGGAISAYVNGGTNNPDNQPSHNGQRVIAWPNNRRLRTRGRRGRRTGQTRSSGLFSVDTDANFSEVENSFRYPPTGGSTPYLSGSFLLGDEKHDRPALAPPMTDTCYAFGENYDLNILAGKCNTINLPATAQELSEPSLPLRALINIRRDSIRLTKCKLPPGNHALSTGCYNVEFVFDTLVKCGITVYYMCQEANNDADGMRFISHPQAKKFVSEQYVYAAGVSQRFSHPEHVLDVNEMKIFSTFTAKQQQQQQSPATRTISSAKRNTGTAVTASDAQTAATASDIPMAEGGSTVINTSHFIPMVVHCVALEGSSVSGECGHMARQSHATLLFLERSGDANELVLKYVKQKVWIGGAAFLLQEIFGIENKHASARLMSPNTSAADVERVLHQDDASDGVGDNDDDNESTDGDEDEEDEDESGNDCVICMSEPRDTVILPCRHLCICSQCAESLRYQANNCPICRAPFKYLLQLRSYLRQTALEQAQLFHAQQLQKQLKLAGALPTACDSLPVTAITVNASAAGERQMSIVPGDSDGDDDDAIDLGKKKSSRGRIEPPAFAGFTHCALIDTLNGTKQAYEALRTATTQQHISHAFPKSVFADISASSSCSDQRQTNGKAATVIKSSASLDTIGSSATAVAADNDPVPDGTVTDDGDGTAETIMRDRNVPVFLPDVISVDQLWRQHDESPPAVGLTQYDNTLANDYDSSTDEDDARENDDATRCHLTNENGAGDASRSRACSSTSRGVDAGTNAGAVVRTGSGHSCNVVLLSAADGDAARDDRRRSSTRDSPRKY